MLSGSSLHQSFVVDYTLKARTCDKCAQLAQKHTWQAKVQLRQRAEHPRTLLAMEQFMRSRRAALTAVDISRVKDGLDFQFARRQDAQRFVTLLQSIAPCRSKASKDGAGGDFMAAKTGASNAKHTWAVEVAPLCRQDLVYLPRHGAGAASGASRWALVTRVAGTLHLLDPSTGRSWELSSEAYWRAPFQPVASRARLSTFIVLGAEVDESLADDGSSKGRGGSSRGGGGKGERRSGERRSGERESGGASAADGADAGADADADTGRRRRPQRDAAVGVGDATIARESDLGSNDETMLVRTHLAGSVEAGDEVVGYDLEAMTHLDALGDVEAAEAPPAVLVSRKDDRQSARQRRGTAAARRRTKRGEAESDAGTSICSSRRYQDSVLGDDDIGDELLDALTELGEEAGRELEGELKDDDDELGAGEVEPALRFLGGLQLLDEPQPEDEE